jgi:hypothetical protein
LNLPIGGTELQHSKLSPATVISQLVTFANLHRIFTCRALRFKQALTGQGLDQKETEGNTPAWPAMRQETLTLSDEALLGLADSGF